MQTGEIIIVGTPWTFLLRIQILKVRSQTDFFSFLAQLLCMSVSSDPNYLYSTFISASSPFDGGAGQFPGTRRDGVSAMWFLPDEVLVDILDRLAPCSLAVSRGVCKAWRAIVDGTTCCEQTYFHSQLVASSSVLSVSQHRQNSSPRPAWRSRLLASSKTMSLWTIPVICRTSLGAAMPPPP
jgi:hypothetical protein